MDETDRFIEEHGMEAEDLETQDIDIYRKLLKRDHPYPDVPDKRMVQIGGVKYSWRWLLAYAHARHSGIACIYTSGRYANENTRGLGESHYCHGSGYNRKLDIRLLNAARKYMLKHKLYQKPKGKPVLETV